MRMNASNSRVSTGMSLLSGGPEPGVPPLLRKSNITYKPVTGQDRAPPHETDGSATAASHPSRRREPRHTFPRPAACIPSNSGSSGKPTARKATPLPCTNAKRRRLVCASLKQLLHFPLDLRKRSDPGANAWIDDDLPSRARQLQARANGFADPPLDPVSNHGPTQGARAGKPHFHAFLSIISQAERGKQWPGKLCAMVVHSTEVLGTQDAGTLGKAGYAVTSRR